MEVDASVDTVMDGGDVLLGGLIGRRLRLAPGSVKTFNTQVTVPQQTPVGQDAP